MIIPKKGGVNLAIVQQDVSNCSERLQALKLTGLAPVPKLDLAYHAILSCASAILELSGMEVTTEKGHHVVMLEFMAGKLKLSTERTNALKALGRSRNQNMYGGKQATNVMMAQEAAQLAEKVCAEAGVWIKELLDQNANP